MSHWTSYLNKLLMLSPRWFRLIASAISSLTEM
jgi:hypothetical protein